MSESRLNRKTALGIGCLAHVVQDGMTATIYILLPILAQVFGFTYAQVGLFKGVKSLAQAVLEMCSGVVTERVGECRVLAIGLVLAGAGYCGLAVAPGAVIIMIGLLVIGAGTAFQHAPSSAMIIAAYATNGRRGALGIYNSSGDVGKLLFTGGFSLAIGVGIAWEYVSLLYGVTALFAASVIAFVARVFAHSPRQEADVDAADNDVDGELGWGILNVRSYATLLAIIFVDTLVQAGILVFVAFLMLSKGLPLWLATTATVLLLAGGIFGKAGCGFLADLLGVRSAFVLIQALTAIGLVCVVLAPDWLALGLLVPLGAVVQGSTSITYGFAADLIHPRRMARGYALLYSSSAFSAVAGPIVFGLMADAWGIDSAIYSMAVVSLLAVLPIGLLPELRETEATPL